MSERMQKILSRLKRDEKTNIIKEQIQKKKEISIRDMLKITRSLNESDDSEDNDDVIDIKTSYDQEEEEKKFRNFFDDLNLFKDFKLSLTLFRIYISEISLCFAHATKANMISIKFLHKTLDSEIKPLSARMIID